MVSTLANAWNGLGRQVAVVALYRDEVSYELEPGVAYISLCDWRETGFLLRLFEHVRKLIEGTRLGLKRCRRLLGRIPSTVVRLARWLDARSLLLRLFTNPLWRLRPRLPLRYLWRLYPPISTRVFALRKALRTLDAPTVVGFCGSTNVTTILAGKPLRNRVIISERNDPARQSLRFPWNDLRPVLYGNADVVTANTRGALETMRAYVATEKLALVPNSIEVKGEAERSSRLLLRAAPRVLIVGRLHPQKAHDVLLEAFAHLPRDLSTWRLSIVGRGEEELVLRALANHLKISGRLDWHGQVVDPYAYYERADIFALPSRHEGMPNALLEAMSCGLPVIVSNASPGPLELVEDGRTGLVVPSDDPLALSDAIARLALDRDLARELGRAAREHVADRSLLGTLHVWEGLFGWHANGQVEPQAVEA